jgi:hypothetical protein
MRWEDDIARMKVEYLKILWKILQEESTTKMYARMDR